MNKEFVCRMSMFVMIIFVLVSCDDDFNSVGSEVIGGVGFEESEYTSFPLAYNVNLQRVQTNTPQISNATTRLLGFYNDPVYGTSTYTVLSQILPTTFAINFEENTVIDEVILDLPYFSRLTNTMAGQDGEVDNTYVLDSVYGNAPIKLSVYRSNYFLTDFEPTTEGENSEFQNRKIYYSNDIQDFRPQVESVLIATEESLVPSEDELEIITLDSMDEGDELDTTKVAPRIRIPLDKNLFKEWILEREGQPELSNSNNFLNYFRGIYLKAESLSEENGSLFAINFSNANITMRYGLKDSIPNRELRFNFSNNVINGIENSFIVDVPEGDTEKGDESLYLKGGEGSYAVLDLFSKFVETDSNGDFVTDDKGNPSISDTPTDPLNPKTELDFLRARDWLINDATLKLYVDREKMTVGGDTEPERIHIFNANTGERLTDFCADPTISLNGFNALIFHSRVLSRGSDDRGEFYEINISRHVMDLINENTDVAKLGIVVSQNLRAEVASEACEPVPSAEANEEKEIPFSSVFSPEGTILHGNTETVPIEKRLQLQILYSRSTRN